VYYTLEGFAGLIGFINPLSGVFCKTCNRMRLSSQGLLKPCLASGLCLDLRSLLRSGADDGALRQAVFEAAARKPLGHDFSGSCGETGAEYSREEMYRIGG
jgi:cyclic pyranopterin phosphate synthase